MTSPRLAFFVLEALPNAHAARRFVLEHAADIAFVGLSNAERPNQNGFLGQLRRHLRRSGTAFLPYLAVNFALPDLLSRLYPVLSRLSTIPTEASATPLKALCARLGVPAFRIDDVNGAAVADAFAIHRPDLIVTFHFDQILSARTLSCAPMGGLNVHPSLLPRHRGPVPTVHALADDPPDFGVTVHRLAVRIDAGSIVAQEAVALPPDVSATGASVLLHERGRILLDRALDTLGRGGTLDDMPVQILSYCGFPDRALLRMLRRRGRRLTTLKDVRNMLRLTGRAIKNR